MTKAAHSIRKWLDEAVAYAKSQASKLYRVHVPAHVDVEAIRTKLGMTQQAFAARVGFSVNTLRRWGAGKARTQRTHGRTCWSSTAHQTPFKRHFELLSTRFGPVERAAEPSRGANELLTLRNDNAQRQGRFGRERALAHSVRSRRQFRPGAPRRRTAPSACPRSA